MLRKVHLHGALGERFGDRFQLDVMTAAEALRALSVQLKGFLEAIKDGAFEVIRGDEVNGFWMGEEDLRGLRLGDKDLHIVPVIAGSKRGGLVKTLLGVALIGAAVFFSGGALAAPIGGGTGILGGITYGNLALAGVALTLAGVSKLLTPSNNGTTFKSTLFTVGTTSEEGVAVPLVYGQFMAQGIMVSAGLQVEQVSPYYSVTYPGQTWNYFQQNENGGSVNGS